MADMNERELGEALTAMRQYSADRAEAAKQEQLKAFDAKLRKSKYFLYGYMVIVVAALVFCGREFFRATSVKSMLMNAVGVLIMYESTVLMKLWYWIVNTKLNLQKDMKELQLQIAELVAGQRRDET